MVLPSLLVPWKEALMFLTPSGDIRAGWVLGLDETVRAAPHPPAPAPWVSLPSSAGRAFVSPAYRSAIVRLSK